MSFKKIITEFEKAIDVLEKTVKKLRDKLEEKPIIHSSSSSYDKITNSSLKVLKVYVNISGTDHDGYCSGNDGYELEEGTGEFIMTSHDVIQWDTTFDTSDFTDDKFSEYVWTGKKKFSVFLKECSTNGSGYCHTGLRYESYKIEWLPNYEYGGIVYPKYDKIQKEEE